MLVVVLCCQCKKDIEPIVTINDYNFLNALIDLGADTDGDNLISPAEAAMITDLRLNNYSIKDMGGIEAFINLKTLNCSGNSIQKLDVSKNTELTTLECLDNDLFSLIVSNNTELKWLNCRNNRLSRLDISNNTALEDLYCQNNQLISLDVSKNNALKVLRCFSETLTTLDISANTRIETLALRYMPSLNKVCVWIMPFPPTGVNLDIYGSPNIVFTTDCSK